MKDNRIIFAVIFLLIIEVVYSQIPVGLKFDLNGQPFNGYFDPFTYSPEKKLSVVHNSDSYEVGYYYDCLDNKINGQIKFENDKIWFKTEKNDYRDKIRPDEIKYFVIGVDSFFVVTNFYYKNKLKTKPEFVQYITEINGNTFARHYHFTSGTAQQFGFLPPIIETFLVKSKDSDTWENFPDNERFKENALKYFGHIPYLEEKISSGDYGNENMMSIIKMAEYNEKYQNKDLIYFDNYWQEINNSNKAEYYARITNRMDSIWTFLYFKNSTKLYKANYSSFYPNTKNGRFVSYHSNSKERQIIEYENDKPKEVKIFDKSGVMKTHYQYIETENTTTSETDIDIVFISIIDFFGNNLIDSSNKFEQIVNDDFASVSYTNRFFKKELVTSYRLINKDTVFQITNPDYDFKIKPLQKKFNNFMTDKEYNEALSVNAQGMILVSFIIDNKGYVVDHSVLNGIHPELDRLVKSFINSRLVQNAEFQHKFKPLKKNKTKQFCEIVIPFEFSINRFYRQPVNYNNFHHMHWQMHQQHMMNNSTPPLSMPSGF
ncbi:MAG: hypothetical protein KAT48_07245 [Bacteroidales bacterium]|nr:hypothetical protein [Bacteroidales bacterium]